MAERFCSTVNAPGYGDCCLKDCAAEYESLYVCGILPVSGFNDCSVLRPDCLGDIVDDDENEDDGLNVLDNPFEAFQLGSYVNAEIAQNLCPEDWREFLSCLFSDCPQFMEVCPGLDSPSQPRQDILDSPEVPECEAFEHDLRESLLPYSYGDCCLPECTVALRRVALCVIFETTGENRSACFSTECPTGINDAEGSSDAEDAGGGGGGGDGGNASEPKDADTSSPDDPLFFPGLALVFGGIAFDYDLARLACSDEFQNFVACVLNTCHSFLDVRPPNLVTPQPTFNEENAPSCDALASVLCDIDFGPPDCCLRECSAEMRAFMYCGIAESTGLDRNNCQFGIVDCPTVDSEAAENNSSSTPSLAEMQGLEVWVNSSFLISSLTGVTARQLLEQLQDGSGNLELLQVAFESFVKSVADAVLGASSERRPMHQWSELNAKARMLAATYDPNSALVYNFTDVPCNDSLAVSRQFGTESTCIACFGKYKLSLEPDDDPLILYATFVNATVMSISDGKLQDNLEAVVASRNGTAPFIVNGVSSLVDESFDPFPTGQVPSIIIANGTNLTLVTSIPNDASSQVNATNLSAHGPAVNDESNARIKSVMVSGILYLACWLAM